MTYKGHISFARLVHPAGERYETFFHTIYHSDIWMNSWYIWRCLSSVQSARLPVSTKREPFSHHTAWIGIWMTKRPGATSDNGFIFKKSNENIKEKKRSCGRFWRAALKGHGQSSQLADFWKIAKMALCIEFFRPNDFSLCYMWSIFWDYYVSNMRDVPIFIKSLYHSSQVKHFQTK